MYYLISGASRYLTKKGMPISISTLRLAALNGELAVIQTVDGARVFEQSALDKFFAKRAEKKTASKPLDKAA